MSFNRRDVIAALQMYKTAKRKLLGKDVHLVWREGGIDWSEASKPMYRREPKLRTAFMAELAKVKQKINFQEQQIQGFRVQYAAGVLCKVVDEWLEQLQPIEAQVLFYFYINHDYERKYGMFKGLSTQEIAKRLNVNARTVTRAKGNGIRQIQEAVECTGE